jgi:hypothetical protein
MKQAVTSRLQTHDIDLFYVVIKVLEPWWDYAKVLKVTVWVSIVYHLLLHFYVHMAVRISCQLQIARSSSSSSSSFLLGPVANAPGYTSANGAYCTYPALDVPTFTASRLSRPHPASDPVSQNRNYAEEKWPINFTETPISTKRLGIFYMP